MSIFTAYRFCESCFPENSGHFLFYPFYPTENPEFQFVQDIARSVFKIDTWAVWWICRLSSKRINVFTQAAVVSPEPEDDSLKFSQAQRAGQFCEQKPQIPGNTIVMLSYPNDVRLAFHRNSISLLGFFFLVATIVSL